MKKIFSILLATTALCAVACTENTPEEASLSVNPTRIEFTAENAAATNVTVTATGTGWSVSVTETGSGWLTAEKVDDKTVTVKAADNTTAEQRIGGVIITPDNEDVSKKEITVVQTGTENPVVYDLQLSSSLLEFEPESAEAQTVTVTVSGDMGWKAEAAEGCAEWVTVTAAADSFTVKVSDNPDTKERIGSVVVTPDNDSVEPKEVTIKQKPKVLPPSLSVDVEELSFKFIDSSVKDIAITAVGCEWNVTVTDETGNTPEWLHVENKMPKFSSLAVTVDANIEEIERVAYINIAADADSVEDIRITVTQEAAVEHYSDLSSDKDLSDVLNHNFAMVLNADDNTLIKWECRFWSEGVGHDTGQYPPFTGTGECMELMFYSSRDESVVNDGVRLPEGDYTVLTDGTAAKGTIIGGGVASWDSSIIQNSWYYCIEEGTKTTKAPIVRGTMNVTHDGDNYVIKIDFEDDLGFKMSGTYTGAIDALSYL